MSAASAMLVSLMVGLMLVLQGCGSSSEATTTITTTKAPDSHNIAGIAGDNKDLSTLVAALKAGGLVDTLSGTGPFTVFAPTNEAFKKLPEALLNALLLPANKAKLVEVLEYHVANGMVLSTDLKNGQEVATLDDKKTITVTITGKTVKIGAATVTTADVIADNGVIHIIDAVLIPPGFVPPTYKNIPEIATADTDLSTLVTALTKGGLVDTLSGTGPFTVFAPTNEAFKKLPEALFNALLLPANKAKLVEVLEYHVANGKVLSTDLKNGQQIATLDDKKTVTVNITGKTVKIGAATVTKADVMAVNGVVHIIDAVLIPPGFVPPTYENIPEIATADTDLSTLVTALAKGGLVDTLSGTGPFTVFAPTNEAFKKLPEALLNALLLPANKAKLVEVLEYHVANGKVLSTDLKNGQEIATLDDKKTVTVTITGKTVKIGAATVTTADVMAVNGVVHIIDVVLIPPGFVPPTEDTAMKTLAMVI